MPAADYLIAPDPTKAGLARRVEGYDQTGACVSLDVVEERPLSIWLNAREIVTAMTIGDCPEYLALGFLRNEDASSAGIAAVTPVVLRVRLYRVFQPGFHVVQEQVAEQAIDLPQVAWMAVRAPNALKHLLALAEKLGVQTGRRFGFNGSRQAGNKANQCIQVGVAHILALQTIIGRQGIDGL